MKGRRRTNLKRLPGKNWWSSVLMHRKPGWSRLRKVTEIPYSASLFQLLRQD